MQNLDDDAQKVRELFRASVAAASIADEASAEQALATYASLRHASDRPFELLITVDNTGHTVGTVRALADHFFLSDVLDRSSRPIAEALNNLAACLPGVVQPDGQAVPSGPVHEGVPLPQQVPAFVKSFDHEEAWREAILIGRAFSALNRYPFSNARTKAVAEAAARIKQLGHAFSITSGQIEINQAGIEDIVTEIEKNLCQIGGFNALSNIVRVAVGTHNYAYEQILFSRKYAHGLGDRPPEVPIGLLYNIAVKLPVRMPVAGNPLAAWDTAVTLARDLVAMLDLEPYSQYAFLGLDAPTLENGLRQVAHYDHCFSLRQWHFSFTPEFLSVFFGESYNAEMKQLLGWSVADAAQLARVLKVPTNPGPQVIPMETLVMAGMDRLVVSSMMPFFAHNEREANRNYRSPFGAGGPDIIFKPFILFERQSLLLPTASVLGPALFEATFAAVKNTKTDQEITQLRGDGTERLTQHLFGKRGFRPTFENAKYDLGKLGAGECDLVFEDDQNIVLVECKAKALTRGAMTGTQGDALLDFAGGLFASQAQALRHERILRSAGSIAFLDGRRLEFRARRITRLTVTLLDHGALQDRWMLRNAYNALLSAQVSCALNYSKKKQVDSFNANLRLFQQETRLLEAAGQDINAHPLNAASASVAQLEIIMEGAQSLTEVRTRLSTPMTHATYNVLMEYFLLQKMHRQAQPPPQP